MNKLLTKIVGIALGATMAIGVGVAIASSNRETTPAQAATSGSTVAYSYTFTEKKFSDNTTAKTLASTTPSLSVTWTPATSWSVGTGYWGYDDTKGQQWGSGSHTLDTMTITSSVSFTNVTDIVINSSIASSGGCKLTTKVGTTSIGSERTLTTTATEYTQTNASGLTGSVSITLSNGSKKKAQYIKSIVIYTKAAATYTVSFDGNGGTGSMSSVSNVPAGSYAMPSNGFTAPANKAFAGWKVKVGDVTGDTVYQVGSTSYTIGSNITLVAQWADQRTMTYSPISSSGTGTGTMTDPNSPYGDGATVTVLANAFTAPQGKRFKEWRTNADGTGTKYVTGDTFEINANTILYAIWEDKPAEVLINHGDVSNPGTGYATRNWTSDDISGTTLSAINSSGYFQFQKTSGTNACFIANSDAIPGPITKIEITKKGSSAVTAFDAYFSTSQITSKPASGAVSQNASNSVWTWTVDEEDEFTYFYIVNGADDTKYFDDITITYKKVSLVDPTEITLDNASAISMDTYGYGKRKLVATVEPYNANNKTVTWGSNDEDVVTIDDGVLTPIGVGTTTVYAHTSNYDSDSPVAALIKTVSVTVTQATYKKATFSPTSTSAASQSDDYLSGSAVSFDCGAFSDGRAQLTTNNSTASFIISGYAGMKITGIDLVMASNGGAGTGSLTVTIGDTDVLEIATAPFSDATWNGAYDANPCHIYKDSTDCVVGESETIEFSFAATVNSLYIYSVSIRYLDYSLETWCQKFLNTFTCSGETQAHPDGAITAEDPLDPSKTPADIWDELGLEFLDLDPDLIDIASKATGNKDSEDVIEQAMARYDLVIRKYGTSTYSDYIERFGEGKVNGPLNSSQALFDLANTSSITTIIVIISVIGLASIGGYFFLRKRKEVK